MHKNRENWFKYELNSASLLTVFQSLPDSGAAPPGIMKPKLRIGAFEELDEQRQVVEKTYHPGKPLYSLTYRKDRVVAASPFRFLDSACINIMLHS